MIPSVFKTFPSFIRLATTPTTIPAIESPSVLTFVLLINPTIEKPMLAGRSMYAYENMPIMASTKPIII